MIYPLKVLLIVSLTSYVTNAIPVVFKESSPSGESTVAISSSDPNVGKYMARSSQGTTLSKDNGQLIQSFSIAGPSKAAAGTGRSFASASASSGNPFSSPFFMPLNLDGFALNNWIRSVESFYDPNFAGNGNVVTAINDNGHIYGKINGVTFDNGVKSN